MPLVIIFDFQKKWEFRNSQLQGGIVGVTGGQPLERVDRDPEAVDVGAAQGGEDLECIFVAVHLILRNPT